MEQKPKLKVAFLGGSVESAVGRAHYSAIMMDNRYKLSAGCFSQNGDINKKSAEQYRLPSDHLYGCIEDLLKYEKGLLDAIIILTPTNQHANHVILCLNEQIPVISEKALAASKSEIESIRDALLNNQGFLSVIYNYLGFPMIRELKYLIHCGELGKIHHIQIDMPQEGFIRIDNEGNPIIPQQWRLKDGTIPIISLDLGVHLHMFIKYLINETPSRVVAKSNSYGNFSTIIDNVSCIIEYTNNITCNMWYSKIATGERNGLKIRIFGQKGSAEWVQEYPEILFRADSKGSRWKVDRGNNDVVICNQPRYSRFKVGHPAGFIEAFANYYNDIAEALNKYKKTGDFESSEVFGINESEEGIKLFEAIDKSSKELRWIDIK